MYKKVCFVLLLICSVCYSEMYDEESIDVEIEGESIEDKLYQGLKNYMQTGNKSADLENTLNKITQEIPLEIQNVERQSLLSSASDETICTICTVVARLLITYRDLNLSIEALKTGLKFVCKFFQTENVCNGAIELNANIFVFIIDNKHDLSPSKICSIIGQPQNCEGPDEIEDNAWQVNLPSTPVKLIKVSKSRRFATRSLLSMQELPININDTMRILHITDIHYDDIYKVGGNAECNEPLCCGADQGEPKTPKARAGAWGDYRKCDMPLHSVEALMNQVKSLDNIDYVYHTGDIINHRVWATSIEKNSKSIKTINRMFLNTFAKKSIPVYPILGNHEPNPLDVFSPEDIHTDDFSISSKWLYDLVAEDWSYWLPNSTMETIRKGGYYTVLVKPGFRIIALNSNVAYIYNWWLLYDDADPYGQLQWLANTLHVAELNNELVHILTHVPVGDQTVLKKWSYEYGRVIKRFSHVIAAQFCGHTHNDELHYFYDSNNIKTPISIAYNGGSFTTFTDVNPNYRIYEINPKTLMVEDFDEYIYNVTEANKYSVSVPPKWYKLYSFKESYGLKSMSFKNMGKLLKNMTQNQTLLDTYFRFKVRDGDTSLKTGCNRKCHETNICNIVTSEFGKSEACESYLSKYRKYLNKNVVS